MSVGIKFNITSATPKTMFRLLVMVFWIQHTVLRFVTVAIGRMPIIGVFADLIVPVLFIGLIAFSMPYLFHQIKLSDFLFWLSACLVILATLLIYPDSSEYIFPELWRILGLSVPLFFIGIAYEHEESKRDLYWCSLLGVAVVFAYQLYVLSTGRVLNDDNMNVAYNILPSIMYLIYWAVDNNGAKNWMLAVAGSFLMFIFGTRGAILAALVFLSICIIFNILKCKNIVLKLFLILLCVFLVIYISSGDGIIRWAMFMSEKFSEIGFSTRVFDFIVEDELANTSGRDAIAEKIFVAITQDPFGGYGFMGDRSIVGTYCHNIVLEILCSYGIVFGGIGIITILSMVVLSIKRSWGNPVSWLMVMSACLVFVKLMFSSSYVFEPYFYMLLGLSIGSTRRCKSSV